MIIYLISVAIYHSTVVISWINNWLLFSLLLYFSLSFQRLISRIYKVFRVKILIRILIFISKVMMIMMMVMMLIVIIKRLRNTLCKLRYLMSKCWLFFKDRLIHRSLRCLVTTTAIAVVKWVIIWDIIWIVIIRRRMTKPLLLRIWWEFNKLGYRKSTWPILILNLHWISREIYKIFIEERGRGEVTYIKSL